MNNKKIEIIKEEKNKMNSALKNIKQIAESLDAGVDERLKWLMDRDFRKKTFEEKPECYLVIRTTYGNDLPLVPICNRMAHDDPRIILGALLVAKSFLGDERVEQDHLDNIIKKLASMVGQNPKDENEEPGNEN